MYEPFCTSCDLGMILHVFLGATWRTCEGNGKISFLKHESEMGLSALLPPDTVFLAWVLGKVPTFLLPKKRMKTTCSPLKPAMSAR